MNLTFTDPTTKEVLTIERIEGSMEGDFDNALGKNPCARRFSCDEEKQQIWPIRFRAEINGLIETKKEGRLRVVAHGSYKLEKGAEPENLRGFSVTITREATGDKLGGFHQHDNVARILRDNVARLQKGVIAAIHEAIRKSQKTEETASSAHSARARVAKLVASQIRK